MFGTVRMRAVRVTFEAMNRPFELTVKPCTDKALYAMKHRKAEVHTGTYVIIQEFRQGIGTGHWSAERIVQHLK